MKALAWVMVGAWIVAGLVMYCHRSDINEMQQEMKGYNQHAMIEAIDE
jgi:hypothetical protein